MLMLSRLRKSPTELRLIGAGVLIGLALYDAYLIAPPFGSFALVPWLLSLIAIGLGLLGWMQSGAQSLLHRMRPAHVQ